MRRGKPVSSQQGMALVLVLLIMTCVLIVAAGFVSMYTARARLNGSNVRQDTAEYVADTGLNKYLWGLNQGNINFFQQNIATYSAYYPEEENGIGGYYYITEQNNASSGASPSRVTVTCTGCLANDPNNQYTVQATLKKRAFTDNIYFTNYETDANGDTVNFTSGDTINGNLSTNGTINISGSPVFNGTVQYAGNPPQPPGNTAQYNGGLPQKVSPLPMPASDAQLAQYAQNGGIYLMGRTCIFIDGTQLTYVNYDENKNDTTYQTFVTKTISIDNNPSFNGAIYVDNASGDSGDSQQDLLNATTGNNYSDTEKFILTRGNVFVSSYDSNGNPQGLGKGMPSTVGAHLTIAAANNIYITPVDPTYQYTGGVPSGTLYSNITGSSSNSYGIIYGRTTFNDQVANIANDANVTSGDDMLGLIANNYIMILRTGWPTQTSPYYVGSGTNYSPYNVNVDAAVMSTSYSFMVEEYWTNLQDGKINLQGSLIQQYRGPVGETNGNGYTKNYWYDSRMAYETPPYFLSPASSGWGIMYWQRIDNPTVQLSKITGMSMTGWNSTLKQPASAVLIKSTLPIVIENVTPSNAFSNQSATWSINPNGTSASIDPYGETWTNNDVILPSSTLTAGSTTGPVIVYATPTVQYQSTSPCVSPWFTNITIMSMPISGPGSVTVGSSIPLTVQVSPGSVQLQNNMTWLVDNPALASISGGNMTYHSNGSYSGTLTGTTTGTVNVTFQITLQDGTLLTSPSFPVTITPVYVKGITVAGTTPVSHGGHTGNYTATVTPANATNPDVTWSWTRVSGSSSLSPTLTSTGNDSATLTTDSHTGTITITATAEDGSGVSGSYSVTIN